MKGLFLPWMERFLSYPLLWVPSIFCGISAGLSLITLLKTSATLSRLSDAPLHRLLRPAEFDAIAYAQSISRLDFIALCLAVLGVGLTLAVIPTFLLIKSAAVDAARNEAQSAFKEELPRMIAEINRMQLRPSGGVNADSVAETVYDSNIEVNDVKSLAEEANDGHS